MQLPFAWWNPQNLAHYDPGRRSERRWPSTPDAYQEKLARVVRALKESAISESSDVVLGLAEVTYQAAHDVRDACLPNHEVESMDMRPDRAGALEPAILFPRRPEFTTHPPIIVPNMPRGTRPMPVLDYTLDGHRIRFIVCHWTARFDNTSTHKRSDIASHLSHEIFEFLTGGSTSEARHVMIMGDLNEEPYGLLEERLHAVRSRDRVRDSLHWTDKDERRIRLYNLTWRLLGERFPHDGRPRKDFDTAGTYYWRKKKTWHTFDQVIVSGSLLSDTPPFVDETSMEVVTHESLLADSGRPESFIWSRKRSIGGVSDHLPVRGRIQTRSEEDT